MMARVLASLLLVGGMAAASAVLMTPGDDSPDPSAGVAAPPTLAPTSAGSPGAAPATIDLAAEASAYAETPGLPGPPGTPPPSQPSAPPRAPASPPPPSPALPPSPPPSPPPPPPGPDEQGPLPELPLPPGDDAGPDADPAAGLQDAVSGAAAEARGLSGL